MREFLSEHCFILIEVNINHAHVGLCDWLWLMLNDECFCPHYFLEPNLLLHKGILKIACYCLYINKISNWEPIILQCTSHIHRMSFNPFLNSSWTVCQVICREKYSIHPYSGVCQWRRHMQYSPCPNLSRCIVVMARSRTNQFEGTTLQRELTDLIPHFTSLSFVHSHRPVAALFSV